MFFLQATWFILCDDEIYGYPSVSQNGKEEETLMKKTWKKLIAGLTVAALSFGFAAPMGVKAAGEDFDGEATVYIGFGGDKEEENDWGFQYNDPENAGNTADIVATNATIKVGDTVTVSLEFPSEVVNTWWMAPVMVAEGLGEVDATVSLKIDGEDVAIDTEAGDAWWYEETGVFTKTQAIRLAGGFNEWGAQYIAEPSGFKTVEYTITLNSAKKAAEVSGETLPYEGTFMAYVGFGGDIAEENDWGFQFNNPEDGGSEGGVTGVKADLAVGETATISLTFPSEVFNTWWMAPVLVAENIVDLDADVSLKIDGQDVEIDKEAGDAWWYEATGIYSDTEAIRLAGGFNEWAAQYIAEPSGFTEVEYTITINSASYAEVAEATELDAQLGTVDKNGTYHAYIGIQTPKYSFRNAWYDAYGMNDTDNPGFFDRITGWTDEGDAVELPGTITDATIEGNGTYTVSVTGLEFPDGEFADQDYMNLIFVDTDIPNTGDITISDMKLNVNGSSVSITPVISPDSEEWLVMLIQNIWNEDVATIGYYPTPVTDISITFNVSGFDYDNEAATEAADELISPAPEETTGDEVATEAAATDEKGGLGTGAIVGIIAGCAVVAGGGAAVVASKKKKK